MSEPALGSTSVRFGDPNVDTGAVVSNPNVVLPLGAIAVTDSAWARASTVAGSVDIGPSRAAAPAEPPPPIPARPPGLGAACGAGARLTQGGSGAFTIATACRTSTAAPRLPKLSCTPSGWRSPRGATFPFASRTWTRYVPNETTPEPPALPPDAGRS